MILRVCSVWLCAALAGVLSLSAQTVTAFSFSPANPGPNDLITITSTLTYSGNCAYGLVGTYTAVTGNTLYVMPVYCGYGSTTTCVSTDSFTAGPIPQGNYQLLVEYHQGSICPISNFDATLTQVTRSLSVGAVATGLHAEQAPVWEGLYFDRLTRELVLEPDAEHFSDCQLLITDLSGKCLLSSTSKRVHLANLPPGLYLLQLQNRGRSVAFKKLVVD